MKRTTTFALTISYEDDLTDADSIVAALHKLFATALSTPGVLDEHGPIAVSELELDLAAG